MLFAGRWPRSSSTYGKLFDSYELPERRLMRILFCFAGGP